MLQRGYYDPEMDAMLKKMFFGRSDIGMVGIFFRFAHLADLIVRPLLYFNIMCLIMNCNNPISAVLSGSMMPVFQRGDFILAKGKPSMLTDNGNIVIYFLNDSVPQIVHRKIEFHQNETNSIFLSKGDNNNKTDIWLYSQDFWNTSNIDSEIIGVLPLAGYVNIFLREHPSIFILWIYYIVYNALR